MALPGYNVEVLGSSSGVAMTAEPTTTSDNQSYQITDMAKQILDLNTEVVVDDGGTPTTEKYTIDYLNGIVTFETVDAGRAITIDGAYLTPATIATADSFGISLTADILENTPFGTRFRSYQQGLVNGTMDLSRFFVADSLFINDLLNNKYKIIKINVNATYSIKAYGLLTSDDTEADVAELVKENVTYQITNQAEF